MGLFGRLNSYFGPTGYHVEFHKRDFLTDASVNYDDGDYFLRIRFNSGIRDGNVIDYMNIRWEETGQVIVQHNLEPGEQGFSMEIDPTSNIGRIGIILVTDDGELFSEDIISIEISRE